MKRYIGVPLWALIFAFLWPHSFFCPAVQAALQGGFAKINITPPLGIHLIGSKGQPSDAILDDLYAKAMVLQNDRSIVAIISVDLLYAPLEEIANPVRRIIREKMGIPEQNVMVCATHTHSGPEVFTLSKFEPDQRISASKIDQSYLGILIKKIADSAWIAHRNMQRVKIGLAQGQLPELVFNRRTKNPDGSVVMTWSVTTEVASTRKIRTSPDGITTVSFGLKSTNPDLRYGPVEPGIWIVRVEDINHNMVGSIVNFACHPVCVYPSLPTTLSADYPGDAMDLVEQTEGGVSLFTLGTAGDMVPYQRGVDAHKQLGRALGAEVLRCLQFVDTSDDISLEAIRKEIRFPVKKSVSPDGREKPDTTQEYIQTEIQVLKLGDIILLGLPGEVLAEVGREIRKRANIDKLILVTLCNDAIGYVCHSEAYGEGGYEPGSATHLAKGAGEIMVNESLDIIGRIQQSK
jgi:neutral ceramidase